MATKVEAVREIAAGFVGIAGEHAGGFSGGADAGAGVGDGGLDFGMFGVGEMAEDRQPDRWGR